MRVWQALEVSRLCMALALTASTGYAAGFAGGDGTADRPYQIASPEQLVALGQDPNLWDKHFVLTRDLDMKGADSKAIRPIGTGENPFLGVFDGGDHRIADLCLLRHDFEIGSGLFGYIGVNTVAFRDRKPAAGHVRNLRLDNVYIQCEALGIGGLAGILADGTITDCSVSGTVKGKDTIYRVGGLVGRAFGQITRCTANVAVYGENGTGGLAGEVCGAELTLCSSSGRVEQSGRVEASGRAGGLVGVVQFWNYTDGIRENKLEQIIAPGVILRCRSECSVSGKETIGGLIGHAFGSGRIEDCYATGFVSGSATVGGLIGENEGSSVIRCYATGRVLGEEETGGLIGYNELPNDPALVSYPPCQLIVERIQEPASSGGAQGPRWRVVHRPAILSCFWDAEASGMVRGLGAGTDAQGGITRLTSAEMRTAATFRNFGWDFESIWIMREGKPCPQLRWEQDQPRKPGAAADQK